MQVYSKKKILHHVTNKTLDDLYKQFYKEYGVWFTTQVKKIIYLAKRKRHRKNNLFSLTKIQQEGKSAG